MNFRPIPPNHPSMKEALNSVSDNMGYIRKDGRCYAVIFYKTAYSFTCAGLTQIDCREKSK